MTGWHIIGDSDVGFWSGVCATIWRPRKWINGDIKYTFFFNITDDGSTLDLRYSSYAHEIDGTINTSTTLLSTGTIAQATVANKLKTFIVTSTSSITDENDLIGVLVERDKNDFQSADFHFFGVLLRYLPNNRQ